LVEVMIVVAIIAILASVAVPAYNDYITRGRIPEATAQLAARQVRMEQAFQDNRTYVGAPAAACPAAPDTVTSRFFDFTCVAAAATYTLTATGKGGMAGFGFSVDQANNRVTTAVPAGWALPAPNTCWVARKGGLC
jgi:type IV pilus assembly protein PilE